MGEYYSFYFNGQWQYFHYISAANINSISSKFCATIHRKYDNYPLIVAILESDVSE